MDLTGAVLLDKSRPALIERGVARPRVIGYRKDGRPIYGARGGTSLWTNMECIYSMPGIGPTKATTTASVISLAAAAQFALESLWPSGGQMLGKSLHFRMSGAYDAGAVTSLLSLNADTTQATQANTVAASAAITLATATVGMWAADIDMTCGSVGSNTSGWFADGFVEYGVNAATSATVRYTVGGANTLGVPTTIALIPSTAYFWEMWSTFGTAPTAFVMSKFKIFAEN